MNIKVGSARHDELGKYTKGKKGDQLQKSSVNDTFGEVSMQNFYVHYKGWYILRPISIATANKIAQAMEDLCNNKNVGYSQNCQRKTCDVLVTKTKGHTVIVVSGNPRVAPKVNYYPKYNGVSTSIVTALGSVGEKNTSLAHRKVIAKANNITNYTGLAIQNTNMLKLLKQGILIKP